MPNAVAADLMRCDGLPFCGQSLLIEKHFQIFGQEILHWYTTFAYNKGVIRLVTLTKDSKPLSILVVI